MDGDPYAIFAAIYGKPPAIRALSNGSFPLLAPRQIFEPITMRFQPFALSAKPEISIDQIVNRTPHRAYIARKRYDVT